MIFLAVIIGLVIIFFLIQCTLWNKEGGETYGFGIFCGGIITALFVLEMVCICESVSKPRPTAMDVYQDKTTLKYTIVDSIKVDSVVVWKENYYGNEE